MNGGAAQAIQVESSVREENLRRLLNPTSIAVVGASADAGKAGSQVLRALAGFPGKVVAIHPREQSIQGVACYPGFAALPTPVDLAIVAIPAAHCVQVAREAAAAGVGGLFIVSGGFGESGLQGAALQAELAQVCRQTGLRLLGPNTSGFINPHQACVASFVPGVEHLRKGRVAVVAQSGGVNLSLSFLLAGLGYGISVAVGLGNAVDVDTADVLTMLAQDPHTQVIALHLEGVPNGRELYDVLRMVTPAKPVVALVAGRADIGEFAVSHTGNLMGSRQRTVAALMQAGAVVVETTEALAQAAAVLSHGRLPPKVRNGVGVVTGQAGPGLLIVDGLKTAGLSVPELSPATLETIEALLPPMTFIKNPVDTGRPGPGFAEVVAGVSADEAIDMTLVFGLHEPAVLDPAQALMPARQRSGKSVVFGTLGMPSDLLGVLQDMQAADIPTVVGPERLVLVAQVLDADARARHRLASQESASAQKQADAPLTAGLDEYRAKDLLRRHGVASPAGRLCVNADEARRAFAELRKPVVVKIVSDEIAHKTEAGGVFLKVADEVTLTHALESIGRIRTLKPAGILVEEMAEAGVELIVGAVRDASWGPCVLVGLGGVSAEAMGDTAVRLAPVSTHDVEDMLNSLQGKALLDGFRHLPVCDRQAIAQVIQAVGNLLQAHPEIREVEINPLVVNDQGALALDALIVI